MDYDAQIREAMEATVDWLVKDKAADVIPDGTIKIDGKFHRVTETGSGLDVHYTIVQDA